MLEATSQITDKVCGLCVCMCVRVCSPLFQAKARGSQKVQLSLPLLSHHLPGKQPVAYRDPHACKPRLQTSPVNLAYTCSKLLPDTQEAMTSNTCTSPYLYKLNITLNC